MCGIVGAWTATPDANTAGHIRFMADSLLTRGPDDSGVWLDKVSGLGLGHRRLSIVDLSANGCQPMHSVSERYVLTFNGEIYNHRELRVELDSFSPRVWRGNSDTETLLAVIEARGLFGALSRLVGMFAFALWDRKDKILHLARDRLGEKPLYYGYQRRDGNLAFLFGSELKALKKHPSFEASIDRAALTLFMRHNYIPTPHSIFKGIHKLDAGTVLSIDAKDFHSRQTLRPVPYWSLRDVAKSGAHGSWSLSETESILFVDEQLRAAVHSQMMADVPLGAFLSGGIDSSTVVALMQAQSPQPIKTFSIGFCEQDFDEAKYAKAVATHLGTDHQELYVAPAQAMQVIPKLPSIYDEPFSDSSQIPTYLVAQLAKTRITVSLSGDAGDELFCGYNRYLMADRLWRGLRMLPLPARKLMSILILSVPPDRWDQLTGVYSKILPFLKQPNSGDKLHKGAKVLTAPNLDQLYKGLISHWDDPAALVIGGHEPMTLLNSGSLDELDLEPIQKMMLMDALGYLPDDILVKLDRAAMAVSLETRVPFLDHRVVELAWRIPQALKLKGGQSKWILRRVLERYVPPELIDRPKMGFGVPIGSWLRGPLKDWACELLDERTLREQGLLNPELVHTRWSEHISGRRNWHHQLWNVLMFQAWLQNERA